MSAAANVGRYRPTRREGHTGLLVVAGAACLLTLVPVITLAIIAFSGSGEDWPHLVRHVVPVAVRTTLLLSALTSLGTAVIGVAAAWAIVAYDFPGRRVLSWALVLPLAVPPYLAAYAFGEFFLYSGPVQTVWRSLFGFTTSRDYWFPDVRSIGGAAFVMTAVLYPYVYLTTRVVFLMQGRNIADVARTLGARPRRVFFKVLLPVARPAIVAGVALVLMETLNDIGAAEYLGVRTMTSAIFVTWINRSSLEGAAQIAMVMLLLVFALMMAERWARRRQRFHNARAVQLATRPPRVRLGRWRGWAVCVALWVPVLLGLGIPLWVFGEYTASRLDDLLNAALAEALVSTVIIGVVTATATVALALLLVETARRTRAAAPAAIVRLASMGYALPGTIVGLGLLYALARFDNGLDALMRAHFGISTGLLLTGSGTAVVLACTIRFLALAEGSIQSGLSKLPSNLDEAARSLGRTPNASAVTVLLPLLRPAILAAGVLVFVDTVKELSATILLRPFGFNTLATLVYENASRAVMQDGALAALLIIATATVPVVLLSRALMRDREAMM